MPSSSLAEHIKRSTAPLGVFRVVLDGIVANWDGLEEALEKVSDGMRDCPSSPGVIMR